MDRLRSFVDSVHPSSTPHSEYAALPLSNLPTPRLDEDEDGDNDFAVRPPLQRRRPTFATSWFYISQGLILLLAVLLVTEIMKDDVVRSVRLALPSLRRLSLDDNFPCSLVTRTT